MNIVIGTSGHPPFDERIFYKFGQSLNKFKHNVAIVCSNVEIDSTSEGIKIKGFAGNDLPKEEKIRKLYELFNHFEPSMIICCEPLIIIAANKFKKEKGGDVKIISDITEYYPSQNKLKLYRRFLKALVFMQSFIFNIYATNLADYLIIGEKGKSKLYRLIAPTKKKAIIGYYPPVKYFMYSAPPYDGKNFTLCYSGNISESRGFRRYIDLIKKAAALFPYKTFVALIVGDYEQPELKKITAEVSAIENVRVKYSEKVSYRNYSESLSEADICIDLRDKNNVFNRSLPIKVFDYMACGKPVIYSNLDSFSEFRDVKKFGILIEPDDIESALERIRYYLENPGLLQKDSQTARQLFENIYNWENEEKKLYDVLSL